MCSCPDTDIDPRSISVSGQLHTFPSPNPTVTLTYSLIITYWVRGTSRGKFFLVKMFHSKNIFLPVTMLMNFLKLRYFTISPGPGCLKAR